MAVAGFHIIHNMNASHLTVRNLPDELAAALEKEKRRRGTSLNQTVIDLLRQSLGVYAGLLSRTLPHVIHTEEENAYYTATLEAVLSRSDRTAEESRLAELLTLLIEDFEDKNYALPPASPLEIIHHLMASNGLRQIDLIDVFGSPGIASEVLSGKRDLAKGHIERLSHRFNASPELFFAPRA